MHYANKESDDITKTAPWWCSGHSLNNESNGPGLNFTVKIVFFSFSLLREKNQVSGTTPLIGPLHDPVTWHGINYTVTQIMQWDFQNKGKSSWTGTSSFVLEVPLRNLCPSVIYSAPCDRIVQRAY